MEEELKAQATDLLRSRRPKPQTYRGGAEGPSHRLIKEELKAQATDRPKPQTYGGGAEGPSHRLIEEKLKALATDLWRS